MLPNKVHDEVISREIVINDADPGVRYKLTKRQTQEEVRFRPLSVLLKMILQWFQGNGQQTFKFY